MANNTYIIYDQTSLNNLTTLKIKFNDIETYVDTIASPQTSALIKHNLENIFVSLIEKAVRENQVTRFNLGFSLFP